MKNELGGCLARARVERVESFFIESMTLRKQSKEGEWLIFEEQRVKCVRYFNFFFFFFF